MKRITRKDIFFLLLIAVFGAICSLCMAYCADDFCIYLSRTDPDYMKFYQPNGRMLTNPLSYLMTAAAWAPPLICIPVTTLLLWGVTHMIPMEKRASATVFGTLFLFLLMPPKYFAMCFMWRAAYPHYMISMLPLLLFLHMLRWAKLLVLL